MIAGHVLRVSTLLAGALTNPVIDCVTRGGVAGQIPSGLSFYDQMILVITSVFTKVNRLINSNFCTLEI